MRRASQDALWRWDAARGRDPFAKGSPPPRPHPIKLLWVLSTVHSAFRSGAGIPEAAPCRHRTMAKGICVLGSEAALVAAPRSRLPRRLLFCRLLFCNKKSAARMHTSGPRKNTALCKPAAALRLPGLSDAYWALAASLSCAGTSLTSTIRTPNSAMPSGGA